MIRDSQRDSQNIFVRKEDVCGHRAVIATLNANLRTQEASSVVNKLVAVTSKLAKATDKIEAMELASKRDCA